MLLANLSSCRYKLGTATIATIGFIGNCNSVRSQIIEDVTANTQIQVTDNVTRIMGGIRAGENLFHSFEQFSLDTNRIASFENSLEIGNIFSRVTGGNISEIDGLIQTQGNANLFLINPAGIIFGANASLDLGGSFIATTAETIIFADGSEFNANDLTSEPVLTINAPIGLQYGTAGEIRVLPDTNREENAASGLKVSSGNSLALLGGDINIDRNDLNAIASNIEISSIKNGTIDLLAQNNSWQFNYDRVLEYGKINLNDRALINSSGIVNFRGKAIDFSNSSGILNFTDFMGNGGIITLEASESVSLNNSFLFTQVGRTVANLDMAISEAGGDISIQAPHILLNNGSVVSAGTLSNGTGGNITLEALETIELLSTSGSNPTIVSTSTQGVGDGGEITVSTGELIVNGGSQIQALAGVGAGGTIAIDASQSIDISGTGILRSQDSSGNSIETFLTSGFAASSGIEDLAFEMQPPGESGNLIVNTPELTIEDSAQISVSNYGSADAGDIQINTTNLNLDSAGEIVANTASGEGGSIDILAEDAITLDNSSSVSTTAEQNGNGGNISIAADNLLLLGTDRIDADAQQGSGGNINIETQGLFVEPDSEITATSQIETQSGKVKIITLDLTSRLFMGFEEYSPLVAEDYIYTGCGTKDQDFQNSFRNIGRGGIPANPKEEVATLETLSDLGNLETSYKAIKTHNSISKKTKSIDRSIVEANSWQLNSQGKIELIARKSNNYAKQLFACNQ